MAASVVLSKTLIMLLTQIAIKLRNSFVGERHIGINEHCLNIPFFRIIFADTDYGSAYCYREVSGTAGINSVKFILRQLS